jgi:signal transduction histidine kinase/DNA-binding response OmpR family regulator
MLSRGELIIAEPTLKSAEVDMPDRRANEPNLFSSATSMRAVPLGEGFARHHQGQQRQHLIALIMILVLAGIPWLWLSRPDTRGSKKPEISSEQIVPQESSPRKGIEPAEPTIRSSQQARHTHATLEIIGSLFGMFTGFALVLRFYTLGNRYHLLIGLAFFVTGVEDLVYGLFFFPELFRDAEPFAQELIPLTFAAGRFLMGLTLIIALLLPGWVREARSARWETIRGSMIVLLIVTIAAALLQLPVPPHLINSARSLQTIDFLALVALATAFFGYLYRYYRGGEMLDWWITASLAVNVIGQLLMLLSDRPFDTLFLAAHVYKVLGYMIPLVGFFLYQIIVVLEYDRSQRDLITAREAALTAASVKAEFLANMSHEIRTPMNGVLGMTERALRTSLTTEQRGYLTAVRDSARSLLNLLNDVLDYSKIESGKFYIDKTDFSLRDCIDSAVQALRTSAQDKGLDLRVEFADDLPEWVQGDARRLRQVLLNLVGNAIKFTLHGGITVEVRMPVGLPPNPSNAIRVDFYVRDTGIGIPREKQAIIFDAFSQADGSTTRRFGGTGLGLAISSELVSMMDGKIEVESEVGKGSCFHFWVWFEKPSTSHPEISIPADIPARSYRSSHPARIILAEDNEINQRLAAEMLREMGHEIIWCKTGLEVIDVIQHHSTDLILMDLQMPEMGGIEATRIIRQMEVESRRHLPIVAITAHAMSEDKQRCLDAGMDGYLSKPIDEDLLFEILERLLGGIASPSAPLHIPERDQTLMLVNVDKLLAQVRGNREILGELVTLFDQQSRELLQQMRQAWEEKDATLLAQHAHKLAGSASNFHSPPTIESAKVIEKAAQDRDWAGAGSQIERLTRLREDLVPILYQVARNEITAPAASS